MQKCKICGNELKELPVEINTIWVLDSIIDILREKNIITMEDLEERGITAKRIVNDKKNLKQ